MPPSGLSLTWEHQSFSKEFTQATPQSCHPHSDRLESGATPQWGKWICSYFFISCHLGPEATLFVKTSQSHLWGKNGHSWQVVSKGSWQTTHISESTMSYSYKTVVTYVCKKSCQEHGPHFYSPSEKLPPRNFLLFVWQDSHKAILSTVCLLPNQPSLISAWKKKSVLTKVGGKLLNQNPGNLGWDRGFGAPQNQAWRFWLAMGGVKGKKGGIRYSWRWGFGIIITSSLCTVLSTPCDLSSDAILFT